MERLSPPKTISRRSVQPFCLNENDIYLLLKILNFKTKNEKKQFKFSKKAKPYFVEIIFCPVLDKHAFLLYKLFLFRPEFTSQYLSCTYLEVPPSLLISLGQQTLLFAYYCFYQCYLDCLFLLGLVVALAGCVYWLTYYQQYFEVSFKYWDCCWVKNFQWCLSHRLVLAVFQSNSGDF